jgi:hypothetical protein
MPIGFVGPALQGASFISRFGIPLLQQAGISAGIGALGAGASALARPVPSKQAAPFIPAGGGMGGGRGSLAREIQDRPVVNPEFLRPDYSGAGERARRFQEYKTGMDIPGANTDYSDRLATAQNTPLNRSYQQEASRVAQMTEQDPLFKKYQVADLTKAYNTAKTPEEKERIGLQIWATTNPSLASCLRPGQTGYQTSAAMSGSQVFGKDIPGITQTFYQQASEQAGVPFPGAAQGASMNAFGLGADAQQLGVSAPGQIPPTMIGENVFKRGIQPPSSADLTQTQLALLKRAFEGRLK